VTAADGTGVDVDDDLATAGGSGLVPRPALTIAPFVAIPVIGEMVFIWSANAILVRDLVASTCLLAVALLLLATPTIRESKLGPSCILVCYVASVATLGLALGGPSGGIGALLVVPLVASALFFGTSETVVATAAVTTASVWTALSHHIPPEVVTRRAILLIAISILIAVPIRALRAHLGAAVRQTRRLLNQSRTLEAAARELTTLDSEEEIVDATVRLAALVASPTGTERPHASYVRAGEGGRPVDPQPAADRATVVVPVRVRPSGPDHGADHGALLVELEAGTIGRECEEGLAALAQIMELALSNVFAHRRLEAEAMNEERRRIARELHDGLAHELAFIAARARTASEHPDKLDADELQRCADRALDEARRAITVLSATTKQPLGEGIAQTAEDLGARYGIPIELRLDDDVDVDAVRAEHLLRIVREAISNAARHGHPTHLVIHLWHDDAYHLVVEDDGVGFELDRAPRGFGLTSMRERAEAVGGELSLRSAQNAGTRVEVHIP
jgi:signal transduction histidine kinase